MPHRLRDGSFTEDHRLDRLQQFDERSRAFPVSEIVPEGFRSKTWRLRVRNDQGPDGACVGFGVGHRLAAAPLEVGGVDYQFSFDLYKEAQRLDPWTGEDYSGTSVLAGVKAAHNRGHIESYYWCFSIEDYLRAITHAGPVVVGTWWDSSMFWPDDDGVIRPNGDHVGGHCYLLRGLVRKNGVLYFRVTNSWGRNWGLKGDALVSVEDFEEHLMEEGEGVVLTEKRKPREAAVSLSQSRRRWWFTGRNLHG